MKAMSIKWAIVFLVGLLTYFGTTTILINRIKFNPPQKAPDQPFIGSFANIKASWNFFNPELELLVTELKKEKEELAARQQELKELQTRIETEKGELLQLTQMVYQMQMEFDKNVIKINEDEVANLKKLAKIYSTMSPDGAAKILVQMPDDVIIKLMMFMKESETAPILESIAKESGQAAKRAALITDKLRYASQKKTTNSSASP